VRYFPLALIMLGLLCALIAALQGISRSKGKARLLSSFSIAGGLFISGVLQIPIDRKPWPGDLLPLAGIFLAWIGWRKFERDPNGKKPASKML
jgi:hypothetical protein